MTDTFTLTHERVDDIPLLLGLAQRLRRAEVLDRHLGEHHLHRGLSCGTLAVVWIAFILSESDHRKSTVQDWVARHRHTLGTLLNPPIADTDFTDDRLSIVLRRLSPAATWDALETDLWRATCDVYELPVERIRLDSTTSSGFHDAVEGGLMQRGHSKDHRPDLPQLKLMAAAAEPSGHLIACDVYPGNAADDPLYVPMIDRLRRLLGKTGLLYTGDCKMSALATRADLVAQGDYDLTTLPQDEGAEGGLASWISAVVDGDRAAQLLWQDQRLLGGGYEFERTVEAVVEGRALEWTERVQVIRSHTLACAQDKALERRLNQAEAALRALTPPRGRGKRQIEDVAALEAAIATILQQEDVAGLLEVTWRREEETRTTYVGPGRGGSGRPQRSETKVRYVITDVRRDVDAIAARRSRHGWRAQVTNAPVVRLSLCESVVGYRAGWCLERDFHLRKDRPLGIRPLWVRRADQLIGLTLLLTLALRLLTLFELLVRQGQARRGELLPGLYPGQARRTTDRPTGFRVLGAIARREITLTWIDRPEGGWWPLTPLPELLVRVLSFLDLSPALYEQLADNTG
jgi:transposase